MVGSLRERLQRARAWARDHERLVGALFFAGGVAWDGTTTAQDVGRPFVLAQLALWQVVLAAGLWAEVHLDRPIAADLLDRERWRRRASYASQFALGALLGALIMHFFHSSSAGPSLALLGILAALLVVNEFQQERLRPLWFRLSLFTFTLHAYLLFAIPVFVARADPGGPLTDWLRPFPSPWLIGLATTLALALAGLLAWLIDRSLPEPERQQRAWRHVGAIAAPLLVVRLLDTAGVMPPVPLCALEVLVVQEVERGPTAADPITLRYRRPWWAPWRTSAGTLLLGPDDTATCFTPIFAPQGMTVDVVHHWERWDEATGTWQRRWTHEMTRPVRGGRHDGFRTWSTTRNALRRNGRANEGWWRCRVQTATGRELGRRRFFLRHADAPPPLIERAHGR